MSLKYSVTMHGNFDGNVSNKKAHARVQFNNVISMEDFAEHIAKHGCKYDRGDIYAVLFNATRCLKELVMEGNKVNLGDLGSFYPALRSISADSVDEFTTDNIKGMTINWEKPDSLSNLLSNVTLQQVSSRAAQAASLKAEKEGKTNATWDKIDSTTGNDSVVTPDDDDLPAGGGNDSDSGGSGGDSGGSGEVDPNA